MATDEFTNRFNEFLRMRNEARERLKYKPNEYDVTELRLVSEWCDCLYSEFKRKDSQPSREAAEDDCLHFIKNFDKFFVNEIKDKQELERLKNEPHYIRYVLGVSMHP